MTRKVICILLSISMIAPSTAAIYAEEAPLDPGYTMEEEIPEETEEEVPEYTEEETPDDAGEEVPEYTEEEAMDAAGEEFSPEFVPEYWDGQVVTDSEIMYDDPATTDEDPVMSGESIIEDLFSDPMQSAAEDTVEEAKAQVEAVEALIIALPEADAAWEEIYACGSTGRLTEANNAYAALAKVVIGSGATVDARCYVSQELFDKLESLTRSYQTELDEIAAAKSLKLGVESLYRKTSSGYQKTADDLTMSDEDAISSLEGKRDSMGESLLPALTQAIMEETGAEKEAAEAAAQALIQKIADARNKMTGLAGEEGLNDYLENNIGPLINSGEYSADQKAEIESLIADAQDEIKEISNAAGLTQEEKEAKIQEIFQNLEKEIKAVKNIYDLEAEAFEALIDAYKTPAEVNLSDKRDIEALRSKYEALSTRAQAKVNTDTIPSVGKTYITRLQELEIKISDKEGALANSKNDSKSALSNETGITPGYDRAIGYSNEYAGIYGMIFSGNFGSGNTEALKEILSSAIGQINKATTAEQIDAIVKDAVRKAELIKDTSRIAAEALEEKIKNLGPVSDLSRSKADQVKALRYEYDRLGEKAKKHIKTNKTSAGDTYKARLDALQARIDKMAQDDANTIIKMIDNLPSTGKIKTSDEGKITQVRKAYASMTKEAKAKVSKEKLDKLEKAEERLDLEKKKKDLIAALRLYGRNKKETTTYEKAQKEQIDKIVKDGVDNINKTATTKDASAEKDVAVKKINAVQTTAQKLKAAGVQVSFRKMHFRTVKQKKTSLYFRWGKVSGINVFQIYGGKAGEEMKLIRQYDYKARSMKLKGLKKKTEYQYKLYACKVVDGEIIPVYASPVIYATTRGSKYGTVKSVKIKKIKAGKKTTKSKKKISLKVGKKAKISQKEKTTGKKLKRRRKVKYESSNPQVAKVSSKGVITALRAGKTSITVYSQSGQYKTIKVTVK